MSWIGVVDCNNFFVSCERLFRPDLHNVPVAVLSSNDGCIVARSQEVKDIGIPMGVPYFKVKDILKDNGVRLFSSHFALYRDISSRIFSVLREEIDTVEQYSIDEAFFSLPENSDPEVVAKKIKDRIETKVGMPVSVGVASSKTQAKFAVELAKKGTGTRVLTQAAWNEYIRDIKLSTIWGIGRQSVVKYKEAGYETVQDLVQADKSRIATLFGVVGTRTMAELQGENVYEVGKSHDIQKSIMSSRSFSEKTFDINVLADAAAYHARHIGSQLRKKKLATSSLRISIQPSRHGDFLLQGYNEDVTFDIPTNDSLVLLKAVNELVQKGFKTQVPYKKVGVSVGGLLPENHIQSSLFEEDVKDSNKELMHVIDSLNSAGSELVTLGNRRHGDKWKARKDMVSPAYTTKWTDVAQVSA